MSAALQASLRDQNDAETLMTKHLGDDHPSSDQEALPTAPGMPKRPSMAGGRTAEELLEATNQLQNRVKDACQAVKSEENGIDTP